MEGPYVGFSQLKAGCGVQRVVTRFLRFWCARNIKKGGELMGVDILLIDKSSTLMQGTIHVHHLPKFEPLLHEGSVYVITGFEVTRSNHHFKLFDFHLSIRFNEGMSVVQLKESFGKIPNELFRFCSHEQLLSLGNTNNELPGDVYLNATSDTRFYFDGDVEATRCFVHRAIVVDILSTNGWSYISCSKCAKKMSKNETALTCNNCFSTDVVGDVKYRVEMVVDNGSESSVFVAFDKDIVYLTNMQVGRRATEIDDTTADPKNDTLIPELNRDIVGKKFTFHIKLKSFNFTSHHRSFTVSCIFDKLQDVPKPTFVEEANVILGTPTNDYTQASSSNNDSSPKSAPTITQPPTNNPPVSGVSANKHASDIDVNNLIRKKAKRN